MNEFKYNKFHSLGGLLGVFCLLEGFFHVLGIPFNYVLIGWLIANGLVTMGHIKTFKENNKKGKEDEIYKV